MSVDLCLTCPLPTCQPESARCRVRQEEKRERRRAYLLQLEMRGVPTKPERLKRKERKERAARAMSAYLEAMEATR